VLIQLVYAQPVILTEYSTQLITSANAEKIALETAVKSNVPHKAIGGMVQLVLLVVYLIASCMNTVMVCAPCALPLWN